MKSLRNVFSQDLFVGYVQFVSPAFLKVHFPSSTLLNKFFNFGEGFHPGIVGEYVVIEGEDYGFLGKIIELSLPEKERLELSATSFKETDFHPIGKIELLICFDYYNETIKKGLNQFPPVGSKVYACSTEALSIFLRDFGLKESDPDNNILFDLAQLPNNLLSTIKVSAQALFNRHCAIVGTTGGGKSWSLARILEETIKNKGKAILLDATGEYHTLKHTFNDKIMFANFNSNLHNTYFHYSSLRETDLYAMFRPAGQAQLPKLQEAMKSLRLVSLIENKSIKTSNDSVIAGHIVSNFFGFKVLTKAQKPRNNFILGFKENPEVYSSNCNFDIRALANQVNKECFSDFGNDGNFGSINDTITGHCVSLVSRILLTTHNKDYENIFGFDRPVSDSDDLRFMIDNFVSVESTKNLLIISLKNVPSDGSVKDILVNAIGRYLLEDALNEKFKKKPILFFVDEAHQFLNNKIKDEYSIEVELNAFERIAKECRKFGLFLILATQMPRDIPIGILSQMGTFIVHRLINESDRRAIEFACSESSKNVLSFLPILSPGEALLTGVDFPMPFILKISEPECKPDSGTPRIFNNITTKL